ERIEQRTRERSGIARWNEDAALRVLEHVGNAAHARRDDGPPGREGLENHVRRSFVVAREREEGARGHPLRTPGERRWAGDDEPIAEARTQILRALPPHAVSDERERHVGPLRVDALESIEELRHALLRLDASDEEDDRSVVREIEHATLER